MLTSNAASSIWHCRQSCAELRAVRRGGCTNSGTHITALVVFVTGLGVLAGREGEDAVHDAEDDAAQRKEDRADHLEDVDPGPGEPWKKHIR